MLHIDPHQSPTVDVTTNHEEPTTPSPPRAPAPPSAKMTPLLSGGTSRSRPFAPRRTRRAPRPPSRGRGRENVGSRSPGPTAPGGRRARRGLRLPADVAAAR